MNAKVIIGRGGIAVRISEGRIYLINLHTGHTSEVLPDFQIGFTLDVKNMLSCDQLFELKNPESK